MFITAKFKGDENKSEVEELCAAVRAAGFDDFCFIRDVEHYRRGIFADPHELMDRARAELLMCDALLLDATESSSGGRTIELGMAFGHDKLVIVIAKDGTELAAPLLGVASLVITYQKLDDIIEPLRTLRTRQASMEGGR